MSEEYKLIRITVLIPAKDEQALKAFAARCLENAYTNAEDLQNRLAYQADMNRRRVARHRARRKQISLSQA